jgi:hypothetical protein
MSFILSNWEATSSWLLLGHAKPKQYVARARSYENPPFALWLLMRGVYASAVVDYPICRSREIFQCESEAYEYIRQCHISVDPIETLEQLTPLRIMISITCI